MENLRINLTNLCYPPEARETRRLELCNSKCFPDEEIDQFVYRLERKFAQAHPEMQGVGLANQRAEMLKICFIAGLPEPHQKKLREIPALTYAQAQLYARQFKAADQYEAIRNPSSTNFSVMSAAPSNSVGDRVAAFESTVAALTLSVPAHYSGLEAAVKQEPDWRTNAARPYNQSDRNEENRFRNATPLTCCTFGKVGHVQRVCLSNPRASERERYRDRSDSRDRYRSRRN